MFTGTKSPDTFDVDYSSDTEEEQTDESDTLETEDTAVPSDDEEELSCEEGFELFEFCTGIDLSESHTCTETLFNELELMQYLSCETFLTAQEELPLCESLGSIAPKSMMAAQRTLWMYKTSCLYWNGPIPQP